MFCVLIGGRRLMSQDQNMGKSPLPFQRDFLGTTPAKARVVGGSLGQQILRGMAPWAKPKGHRALEFIPRAPWDSIQAESHRVGDESGKWGWGGRKPRVMGVDSKGSKRARNPQRYSSPKGHRALEFIPRAPWDSFQAKSHQVGDESGN